MEIIEGQALSRVIIYTDGASRSNPGPAAAAWVICDEKGNVLLERATYLGTATNNEAEYRAIAEGLRAGAEICTRQAVIRSDSQLAINQLNGTYKLKSEHLLPLLKDVNRRAAHCRDGVTYEHRARASRNWE